LRFLAFVAVPVAIVWLFNIGLWWAAIPILTAMLVGLLVVYRRNHPRPPRPPKPPKPEPLFRYEAGVRLALPRSEWERMKVEADGRCFYCAGVTDVFEAEHVIPVSRGGSSQVWNFVAACRDCNRIKGSRTGWEFVPDPTPEQRLRFEEIDRLTTRRRLAWLERRRLRRAALARRRAGARKRSEVARAKREAKWDEEFERMYGRRPKRWGSP
jgi:hypothetical protein